MTSENEMIEDNISEITIGEEEEKERASKRIRDERGTAVIIPEAK